MRLKNLAYSHFRKALVESRRSPRLTVDTHSVAVEGTVRRCRKCVQVHPVLPSVYGQAGENGYFSRQVFGHQALALLHRSPFMTMLTLFLRD
jgi:hypothetical protein